MTAVATEKPKRGRPAKKAATKPAAKAAKVEAKPGLEKALMAALKQAGVKSKLTPAPSGKYSKLTGDELDRLANLIDGYRKGNKS